jgi:hypothetical protein
MADDKQGEIYDEAMKRFESVEEAEETQREKAVEVFRFINVPGAQWEDWARDEFEVASRPRYEINRIAATIDTIIGEQRKTEISQKYRPAGMGATPDVAKTFNGLVRNIDSVSDSRNAYDNAFEELLSSGYGGWRIVTEYADDDFNQDILIRPIYSACTTLWFDPGAKLVDKSDAMWAFVTQDITTEEFKARWPRSDEADFDYNTYFTETCDDWRSDDGVRVAEYWRKVPVTRTRIQLSDGRIIDEEEDGSALEKLAEEGITEVRRREIETFKVEQYIMNGAEILEGPNEWAGKYIPLVPVFGHRVIVDGKEYVRGIGNNAMDASRINNYAVSATVEAVAGVAKDRTWMTKEQAKGHESELARMNLDNPPVAFYNHVPGVPVPTRDGAPAVQSALIGITQKAEENIVATLGVMPGGTMPNVGTSLDTRSGKAVVEQGRKADTGTFIYWDALIKGVRYTGKILADLIPRIYDVERQVRTINPDGSEEFVTINQTVMARNKDTGAMEKVIVNDLSQGKYDIFVDTGPAFQTQRVEAYERLDALAQNNPMFAQATPDLLAKNLDVPGSDELYERIRKVMIANGTAEPTEEELAEMQSAAPKEPTAAERLALRGEEAKVSLFEGEAANKFADAEKKRAEAAETSADIGNTQADTLKKSAEALGTQLDNLEKAASLGIPLTEQDRDNILKLKDAIEASLQEIVPGPPSEEVAAQTLTGV